VRVPVEVKVPTILRTATGGESVVTGDGGTVRELLEDLEARYPGIRARVVTDDGGLHRFVNVYVNDEDVRYLGSLETELKDGDVVSILPAVAGGTHTRVPLG
jgi:molybdopterin synthase sulfur carrier subunit